MSDEPVLGQEFKVVSPEYLSDLGWHKDCVLEYRYTTHEGVRAFYCGKHEQWVYQYPKAVRYEYGDDLRPVDEQSEEED